MPIQGPLLSVKFGVVQGPQNKGASLGCRADDKLTTGFDSAPDRSPFSGSHCEDTKHSTAVEEMTKYL